MTEATNGAAQSRAPVIFEVPGEIRGKGRPRFVRATGRTYTPEATRSYEAILKYAGVEAMAGRPPFDGPVRLTMVAIFGVPASWSKRKRTQALIGDISPTKKPDADNIIKLTDALNAVVWGDDAQVVDVRLIKKFGEHPNLQIRVECA
jgi:Holliday junction resolvase RusA-like endonuclease